MYAYVPRKTNHVTTIALAALTLCSLVIMLFTAALPTLPYRSLVQLLAMLLLAGAILLVNRYVARSYEYRITERENGSLDFEVTELRRKSRITVCRIGLGDVTESIAITKENRSALRIRCKRKKRYNYCVELCPARAVAWLVADGDEELVIVFSPDDRLLSLWEKHKNERSV